MMNDSQKHEGNLYFACYSKWICYVTFIYGLFCFSDFHAQVYDGATASYGLHKLHPSYTGSAIQIRRSCDNALKNIGFTTCGDLDTTAIKSFALAVSPLSSITSGASIAFSLRRLTCSFAGNAINVRSSAAGSPTINIGFTSSGDLDTATLKTFIGSNSGFVAIWYDQSGNAKHAVQTVDANQPCIVSAGVVQRCNGMPAIVWQNNTQLLVYGVNDVTIQTIISTRDLKGASYQTLFAVPANSDFSIRANGAFDGSGSLNYTDGPNGNDWVNGTGVPPTMYVNGVQTLAGKAAAHVLTSIAAGAQVNRNFSFSSTFLNRGMYNNDAVSELIAFPGTISATDQKFVEWSQSQYYNIGGIALGTIPGNALSAYVSAWYDQSGNGVALAQSTNSQQLQILTAGLIPKLNGLPTMQGLNANQTNLTGSLSANYTGSALNTTMVLQTDMTSTASLRALSLGSGLASTDNNSTNFFDLNLNSTNQLSIERNLIVNPSISVTTGSGMILSTSFNGAQRQLFRNGTGSATFADANSFNYNTFRLMQSIHPSAATQAFTGRLSEFSLYNTTLSATRRILIETNESAYYAITSGSSKYTPPAANSYFRYINGLGRESATDSVSGTRSTVGMGFYVGQLSTDYLKDNGDYMTSGIDCPLTPGNSALNLPATVLSRWTNDWYINKTDVNANGGNITIYFDWSDYGIASLPGLSANYVLLYRSSPSNSFAIVPGVTQTTSGDRVQFSVNASNITTNYYYTIGTTNSNASTLPIGLLNFDADVCGTEVCLNWSTSSEKNNHYFIVQRSADAVNWQDAGMVNGAGNSFTKRNYTFKDTKPLPGLSYYQLKQVDFSKEFTYSAIDDVLFDKQTDLTIFPNPASGILFLVSEGLQTTMEVTVMSVLGIQVVPTQSMLFREKSEIDVSDLDNGVYFLKLSFNGQNLLKKFVVRH